MAAPLCPQLRFFFPDYPSWKLNVYVPGTTTRRNSYSDDALATANANPVVAAASGLMGAVYLDPALSYKFVAATSADVEIFTQETVDTVPGQELDVLSKTANYTVLVGDGDDVLVLCDTTTGAFTVTLYTAVGNTGNKITIMKTDSALTAVTVDPNGSQTINGLTTVTLQDQYESLRLVSDGSNWVSLSEPDAANASLILAAQVFGG